MAASRNGATVCYGRTCSRAQACCCTGRSVGQSVGRLADEACRRQKGKGRRGAQNAVILRCIRTDGAIFEWGTKKELA
jgi:hypothetical protein